METISILVPCIFTSSVIHAFMPVTSFFQPSINTVFVGINQSPGQHSGFYQWLDGYLADTGKHMNHDLPTTLYHTKDRRFLFRKRPSTTCTLETISTAFSSFFDYGFWVSFVPCHDINLIKLDLTMKGHLRLFLITPSRS